MVTIAADDQLPVVNQPATGKRAGFRERLVRTLSVGLRYLVLCFDFTPFDLTKKEGTQASKMQS